MEDIEELIEVIQKWHAKVVTGLQMIADSDDETEIKLNSSDGKTVTLADEHVKPFKWGVAIALEQFKKLPFTVHANEFEDEQED